MPAFMNEGALASPLAAGIDRFLSDTDIYLAECFANSHRLIQFFPRRSRAGHSRNAGSFDLADRFDLDQHIGIKDKLGDATMFVIALFHYRDKCIVNRLAVFLVYAR